MKQRERDWQIDRQSEVWSVKTAKKTAETNQDVNDKQCIMDNDVMLAASV